VSSVPRVPISAPFRQRSFRFQWPADLAASWAFEMEMLILAWFVLNETGSVVWLTAFAALQYLGTLISPMVGVMGDRIGHRRVLMAMRATYAVLAALLAAMALSGTLGIVAVFCIATLAGLVRPSDIGMRNALIGATMPAPLLMGAMSVARTSADGARVVGALSGAALVAWLGIGLAYLVVLAFYLSSLALLFGIRETPPGGTRAPPGAVWGELAEGVAHVRASPALIATLALAFLANALAFPLSGGLLPHVARDVYGIGQTGLGALLASFSGGALAGSVLLGARGARLPAGRTMLVAAMAWFLLLAAFALIRTPLAGMAVLALAGFVQSFCMVPMAVLLLRVAQERFRGRVMGLRMLAVYGLPIGLLAAGPLIARFGFAGTALGYATAALACTALIGWRWRGHLWARNAPANAAQA